MTLRRTRPRTVVRLIVATALCLACLVVVGGSPASGWCSPGPSGSGLKTWGEELWRGSTCDGDWWYGGKVRDSPSVADGYCAHVRLNSGGGWFTQAYSCTGSWINYSVTSAPAYATQLCKGTTAVCSIGSYQGA